MSSPDSVRGRPPDGLPGAIAKESVVTLDRLDGASVIRSFGYVTGRGCLPNSPLRGALRSIGALIGLAPIEYLTDAERAREAALDDLRRAAGARAANAVINLRFRTAESPDGATVVTAFGEAVLVASEAERA